MSVAFIDLDRLKFVNDSLGHDCGDELLKAVAERMQTCVRKADTVARLGGDEFVLISLHHVDSDSGAFTRTCLHIGELLAKVQKVLGEPLLLHGSPFSATCSIGVSVYPQHGASADQLLKHADAAMYLAKKSGRNKVEFFAGGASLAPR
jgi:diguanylate cyclase (GGDEF)-like protein